jgi:hypothetical protein
MHKIQKYNGGFNRSNDHSSGCIVGSHINTGNGNCDNSQPNEKGKNQKMILIFNDVVVIIFAHSRWWLMDEVEQREQENPDQIDQVPVKAAIFEQDKPCTVNGTASDLEK